MTGNTRDRRTPGATLLTIARLLFDEQLVASVVLPTIADLEREIGEAGGDRIKRLRAQWRGYSAFWRVAVVCQLTSRDAMARVAVGAIVVALLAIAGRVLGAWAAIVIAVGALFAIVLHAWYDRHPSDLPTPEPQRRAPQINFSSTEVAGDIGGLIFAVGSVFVVVVGVPSVIWFLLGATAAGCVVAWALVSWRTKHPQGLPENRLLGR